jgi:two-component system sensor kinase FixL
MGSSAEQPSSSDPGRAGGKSESHQRSILATVPDAMVVIDEAGRMLSFSAAAEKMFGFA